MSEIDVSELKPVPQNLLATVDRFKGRVAYRDHLDGAWQSVTWGQYGEQIQQAARALVSLGLKKGDIVCILGGNRPEWGIMAHAAMMIGCPPAGIYFTCSAEEIEYIVNHSESPFLLCETEEHIARLRQIRARTPHLRHVAAMDRTTPDGDDILSWQAFTALGDARHHETVDARCRGLVLTDTAVLVYTSGTLGRPKAAIVSHRSAAWVCATLRDMFGIDEHDRLLSYLPLAHIAEMTNTILSHASIGNEIWFCLDTLAMPDRLPECSPTVFFGVPRVWQKIEEKIAQRLADATGIKGRLANWAVETGKTHALKTIEETPISAALRLQHRVADKLVLSKVRAALGLSECALAVSGAAPISRTTVEFIAGLGITICEVYGQSEDCGPTTMNLHGVMKLGTVGRPLPGLDIKIAPDDEILVRSPSVFDGYLKDDAATAATLVDGWMHTGDLGRIDNEGFLTLIGRKKEIMITAGGKNIAPARIEGDIVDIPLVEHAVLIGEGKRFLTALLTISPDVLDAFAQKHDLPDATPTHPRVQAEIAAAVDRVNARYARAEQVRKFAILERPLSQEMGELTPTMKMKRARILSNHAGTIDTLYDG